jgi:hypothetical protein
MDPDIPLVGEDEGEEGPGPESRSDSETDADADFEVSSRDILFTFTDLT